ncbi:MBL fold metallo-hydrolase [Thalassomonas viridans]|nr:MBL fold metallo-hydrolase [Thalassomonas viridans]
MSTISCSTQPLDSGYEQSPQFRQGKFQNLDNVSAAGMAKLPKIIWRYLFDKSRPAAPQQPVPLENIDMARLTNTEQAQPEIYRLGHSSLLLNFSGEIWLLDPVFSKRASPVSWMGPERFHPLPFELDKLPKIRGVIISHDHYDHLDKETIAVIADRVEHFVTPLGVGRYLQEWGVEQEKIHQLDWWQGIELGSLSVTATPAQHFSGRGLTDRDETLWASWVLQSKQHKLFFSGDTGYFDGFKTIGDRFGPFDLTILENGAYDKDWAEVHMTPEQTLQAHLDLRGKALMPVHNSTFDLALHAWYEPLERLSELAQAQWVPLVTPVIGQPLPFSELTETTAWWRAVAGFESESPIVFDGEEIAD